MSQQDIGPSLIHLARLMGSQIEQLRLQLKNNIMAVLLERLLLLFDGWSRSSIALSSCAHKFDLNTKQT